MTRFLRTCVVVVAALCSFGFAIERVAIGDILKEPAKFDHKVVTVVGTVAKFRAKISKKGNDYFNFRLQQSAGTWISVFGEGKLERMPVDGDKVEVTGEFVREKTVAEVVFNNEIDVTKRSVEEKTKDYGIKILIR